MNPVVGPEIQAVPESSFAEGFEALTAVGSADPAAAAGPEDPPGAASHPQLTPPQSSAAGLVEPPASPVHPPELSVRNLDPLSRQRAAIAVSAQAGPCSYAAAVAADVSVVESAAAAAVASVPAPAAAAAAAPDKTVMYAV